MQSSMRTYSLYSCFGAWIGQFLPFCSNAHQAGKGIATSHVWLHAALLSDVLWGHACPAGLRSKPCRRLACAFTVAMQDCTLQACQKGHWGTLCYIPTDWWYAHFRLSVCQIAAYYAVRPSGMRLLPTHTSVLAVALLQMASWSQLLSGAGDLLAAKMLILILVSGMGAASAFVTLC